MMQIKVSCTCNLSVSRGKKKSAWSQNKSCTAEKDKKKNLEVVSGLMCGCFQQFDHVISHNNSSAISCSLFLSYTWDMIQCLNKKREENANSTFGSHRASLHYPWFPLRPQPQHPPVAAFLEGLFIAGQQLSKTRPPQGCAFTTKKLRGRTTDTEQVL